MITHIEMLRGPERNTHRDIQGDTLRRLDTGARLPPRLHTLAVVSAHVGALRKACSWPSLPSASYEDSGEEFLGVLSLGSSCAPCKRTLDTPEPCDLYVLAWVTGVIWHPPCEGMPCGHGVMKS